MFNLEKEVDALCRSIHTSGWTRESRIAELKDHLYCEIEALTEAGLSEEEAFLEARNRFGDLDCLRIEHSKNRSFPSIASEVLLTGSLASLGIDMPGSRQQSLWLTVSLSVGILLGGVAGAAVGALLGSEFYTIASYVLGFILGAALGTLIGWQILSRPKQTLVRAENKQA